MRKSLNNYERRSYFTQVEIEAVIYMADSEDGLVNDETSDSKKRLLDMSVIGNDIKYFEDTKKN